MVVGAVCVAVRVARRTVAAAVTAALAGGAGGAAAATTIDAGSTAGAQRAHSCVERVI